MSRRQQSYDLKEMEVKEKKKGLKWLTVKQEDRMWGKNIPGQAAFDANQSLSSYANYIQVTLKGT